MPTVPVNRSRWWYVPWLGLACILVLHVIAVIRLHPRNFFGYVQDDSIYFSSAKALAQGKGYVLLSFPGTPPATKYPILYPAILSLVWRWNPSFPQNLSDAAGLNVAFAITFLILAFVFLRGLKGISDPEALLLTAFCALHPAVLFYSGSVLSEMPFAAVALGAVLAADKAIWPEEKGWKAALCGVLAGLGMLLRFFGLPVVAGIVVAAILRRAWRPLLIFSVSAVPFLVAVLWRVFFVSAPVPPVTLASRSLLGLKMTWIYHTSYYLDWRFSVPNLHILRVMLENNAGMVLRVIPDYFLWPVFVQDTRLGRVLVLIVSAMAIMGMVRQARDHEWKPIHFVLPFYSALVLLWLFPDTYRYFLPFLPLFVAGLWYEAKYILGMEASTFGKQQSVIGKIVSASMGVLVVALTFGVLLNYLGGIRKFIEQQSQQRGALLVEKREAYDWISNHTPADARIIAYEDAVMYLYTGRQALRPIAFSTAAYYEPDRLHVTIDHIADVARAIDANCWIVSDDDFELEWKEAASQARNRVHELEKVLPLLFKSQNGHVRIYGLDCLRNPEQPSCSQADRLLFPSD